MLDVNLMENEICSWDYSFIMNKGILYKLINLKQGSKVKVAIYLK